MGADALGRKEQERVRFAPIHYQLNKLSWPKYVLLTPSSYDRPCTLLYPAILRPVAS